LSADFVLNALKLKRTKNANGLGWGLGLVILILTLTPTLTRFHLFVSVIICTLAEQNRQSTFSVATSNITCQAIWLRKHVASSLLLLVPIYLFQASVVHLSIS